MHISKATPSTRRLFAPQNIHYNKNPKVQNQNETKVKKLQKLLTHCNTFSQ